MAVELLLGGVEERRREPELRAPATLDALAALGQAGRIDRADAERLAAAYRRLRTIEHRLQMIDDRQTQMLPDNERDRARVAFILGFDGWAGFQIHQGLQTVSDQGWVAGNALTGGWSYERPPGWITWYVAPPRKKRLIRSMRTSSRTTP